MDQTIFFGIITGLLLFILGWLINMGVKIGKFDNFMISTIDRLAKVEERLDLIDRLNGILDKVVSRLDELNHRMEEDTE